MRLRAWLPFERVDHPTPVSLAGNFGNVIVAGSLYNEELAFDFRGFINFEPHSERDDAIAAAVRDGDRYIELRDELARVEVDPRNRFPD